MSATVSGEYTNSWYPYMEEPGDMVHLIPDYDSFNHYTVDCPCCPTDVGDMIIHNSWDGREYFETGRRKPS